MNKSESIKNLALALFNFQAKAQAVKKTATNPFFNSKYATLDMILDTIKQPLFDCGLVVSQVADQDCIETVLMHAVSGEWISGKMKLCMLKQDPQAQGSAITYARRYSLGAILGLATDEDDDANTATEPQAQKQQQPKKEYKAQPARTEFFDFNGKPLLDEKRAKYMPSEKQLNRLYAISKSSGWEDEEVKMTLESLGVTTSKALNVAQYEWLCDYIQANPVTSRKS